MSNPIELLNDLKDRQVKPKPLYCTASSNCWCMKLETRLPSHEGYDVCLSPKTLLEMYSGELPKIDINYLNSLLSRECIW